MVDYLSLVAKSGQVNTPPGSYNTIKEWIANSFMGPHSNVLEIGCSMGFITIEMARYVGATCCGLDLHAGSVNAARGNVDPFVSERVSFVCGDAGHLQFPNDSFSHVVVGGHLPFIPAEMRMAHIAEAIRVTRPWGYILTALYFYESSPPKTLVDEFNREVGTNLDASCDYAYWSGLFNRQRLTLEYESVNEILPADSARVETYLRQLSDGSRQDWENRLRLFNENGKYLNYFVRVYRKIPDLDKVMLQIPRGGIYQTKRISQQTF